MRILALATLVVSAFVTVNSKFDFGLCPGADTPRLAFSDYAIATPVPHFIDFMDYGFVELLSALEYFGFKPYVDYMCGQLGDVEPWKSIAKA